MSFYGLQPHMIRYKHGNITLCGESLNEIEGGAKMYAIIETGGKQIKVEVGQPVFVEKLEVNAGDKVTFDKVVLVSDTTTKVGTPYVEGATVTATVEKQGKAKKIVIYKYKAKKGSTHRKQGHRQPYTKLIIDSIEG